jgi:hypothetical protein
LFSAERDNLGLDPLCTMTLDARMGLKVSPFDSFFLALENDALDWAAIVSASFFPYVRNEVNLDQLGRRPSLSILTLVAPLGLKVPPFDSFIGGDSIDEHPQFSGSFPEM